jgi:hypothetical protein
MHRGVVEVDAATCDDGDGSVGGTLRPRLIGESAWLRRELRDTPLMPVRAQDKRGPDLRTRRNFLRSDPD